MIELDSRELPRDARVRWGHPFAFEWKVSAANEAAYPLDTLVLMYEITTSKERAKELETIYLVNYRDYFGEYPPHNQAPRGYKQFTENRKGRFYFDESRRYWTPPEFR